MLAIIIMMIWLMMMMMMMMLGIIIMYDDWNVGEIDDDVDDDERDSGCLRR